MKKITLILLLLCCDHLLRSQTLLSETFDDVGTAGVTAEGIVWNCNSPCNGGISSNGAALVCNNPKDEAVWTTGTIDVSGYEEVLVTIHLQAEGDIEGACNIGTTCQCAPIPNQSDCGTYSSFDFIDFGYQLDGGSTFVWPNELGCGSGSVSCSPACGAGPYPSCDVSGGGTHTYFGDCLGGAVNDADFHNGNGSTTFTFSKTIAVGAASTLALEFTMMNSASGEIFRILDVTVAGTVLPVELVSFNARKEAGEVRLLWQTASENNNRYFQVERALGKSGFAPIGEVPGNGTAAEPHSYQFLDPAPMPGLNYYRLRQVDEGGAATFSPVVSADLGGSDKVAVFPNPATDWATVRFPQPTEEECRLYLFDQTGRAVRSSTAVEGTVEHELPLSGLPAGWYSLKIQAGGKVEMLRVMRW